MKKTEYSGMNMRVGNPSFLYDEMLDDYEDSTTNPNFAWSHDGKVKNAKESTFSPKEPSFWDFPLYGICCAISRV